MSENLTRFLCVLSLSPFNKDVDNIEEGVPVNRQEDEALRVVIVSSSLLSSTVTNRKGARDILSCSSVAAASCSKRSFDLEFKLPFKQTDMRGSIAEEDSIIVIKSCKDY